MTANNGNHFAACLKRTDTFSAPGEEQLFTFARCSLGCSLGCSTGLLLLLLLLLVFFQVANQGQPAGRPSAAAVAATRSDPLFLPFYRKNTSRSDTNQLPSLRERAKKGTNHHHHHHLRRRRRRRRCRADSAARLLPKQAANNRRHQRPAGAHRSLYLVADLILVVGARQPAISIEQTSTCFAVGVLAVRISLGMELAGANIMCR